MAAGILELAGPGEGRAVAATEKETELNARQAYAAARYDEAIEIYARLYAETLNPIYLRNIARCHQKKRDPDKAIDAFQDYLAKGKSITSAERKEIQGYVKDMERLRDEQAKDKRAQAQEKEKSGTTAASGPTTPTVSPGGAPANGTGAGSAGDGSATIRAPWAGQGPAFAPGGPAAGSPAPSDPAAGGPVLVARPGEAPSEPARPVYKRWWFWTAIGVVAAGGVAAALLIPGGTTRPTCFDATPGVCK